MNILEIDYTELTRLGIDPKNVGLAIQLRQCLLNAANCQKELPRATTSDHSSKQMMEINEERAFKLAIACCAFFHGFEEIDGRALSAIHTILAAKFDRMLDQLKMLANRKKQGRPTAFKNPVHQVLNAHSLPVQDLMEFYQIRVIKPCQKIAENFIEKKKFDKNIN